jgi:hypothetical protein
MSAKALLNEQEKFVLDTMRSVAKILAQRAEYREYHRRLLYARKMAAKGRTKEAAKEFDIIKTKFHQMWRFSALLNRVYVEGFHDGAHEAGMQYHIGKLRKSKEDPV